jgi:hypothetical protein
MEEFFKKPSSVVIVPGKRNVTARDAQAVAVSDGCMSEYQFLEIADILR